MFALADNSGFESTEIDFRHGARLMQALQLTQSDLQFTKLFFLGQCRTSSSAYSAVLQLD